MNRHQVLCPVLCILFFASGCASIVGKSQFPVKIGSQPDQADITIVDETGATVYSGKTPTTVTLHTKAGYFKGKNYTVTFSKPGYAKHTAEIRRGVSGWYIFGNLAFGGLIGWLIVDPLTGSMWTLQEELNVELQPESASVPSEGGFRILQLDEVPISLRSRLVELH